MSFKIDLKCVRKSESIDGDSTYTEITLQPEGSLVNPGAAETSTAPTPAKFTMSGAITFNLRDAKESANYKVGEVYSLTLGSTTVVDGK